VASNCASVSPNSVLPESNGLNRMSHVCVLCVCVLIASKSRLFRLLMPMFLMFLVPLLMMSLWASVCLLVIVIPPNRLPATVIINYASEDKGGSLSSILPVDDDGELEIEISRKGQLEEVIAALVDIELQSESERTRNEFVGAALTEPIDDPLAKDPKTIREAQLSVFWAHWLTALYEELESLKAQGVYVEVDELPPGRKAVDSKWVLHIKHNGQGLISRFKARLVAKGFTQIPGQDFTYTFAPVARWESIRVLLAIVATYDWELRQVDMKTAFLNGPLEEEIYMNKPDILGPGF
jgi:hypothetical protein